MNPRNPVNGATYLTLGILSLVLCPLLGPVAWSMSSNALQTLDRYERTSGDTSQRGLVVAGRICGIIGTALLALSVCLLLMRGCAEAGRTSSANDPRATTVTIDGRPASPAERDMMLRQINDLPTGRSAPASHATPKP